MKMQKDRRGRLKLAGSLTALSLLAAPLLSAACVLPCSALQPLHIGMDAGLAGSVSMDARDQVNDWFPVPDWLSGTWAAKSEVILQSFNYATGAWAVRSPITITVNRSTVIGMQRDGNGRIWHCASTPYVHIVETDNFIEQQVTTRLTLVDSSPGQLTVDTLASVNRLDKRTMQTSTAFTEETTAMYEQLRDGLIQVNFIIKDFDQEGRQISGSQKCCIEFRAKPFQQVDHDPDRGNLKDQFARFMRSGHSGN